MIKSMFIILALFALSFDLRASENMEEIVNSPRISDIKFSGIYPFFSTELLDRMTIYPGSVYDEEKIEMQKEYIRNYIRNRGFDSVRVVIETENISDRLKLLKFKINKRGYYALQRIKIEGNSHYSDIRLKKEMKTWWVSWLTGESGRLVPDDLEKDVKTLEEFYRGNYFADVEISSEVLKDSLKGTAGIVIKISEGAKYKIELSGNRFFGKGSLSEQTNIIKEGRHGSVAVRQIVRDIRRRYREEGFNDIKIEWQDTLENGGANPINRVYIDIQEGIRPLVADISFTGNASFTGSELSPYLNSVVRRWWRTKDYFRRDMWEDDERNITAFYNRNGFLSAKVKTGLKYSKGKDSLKISVSVSEGIMTEIGEVKFTGSHEEIQKELSFIAGELGGKPYNPGMISERSAHIKGLLASRGYVYAQVNERTVFTPDSSKADINFTVEQKNIAGTGRIFVAGNLKTKERTVKKLLRLKEGEPFSIIGLSKGLRNLRNQKIFRSVSSFTPDMDARKDTLDVLIAVEEYPPYYFQASGGYESFTGPYFSLLGGNRNFLGRNKDLSLRAGASLEEQKVTGSFTEPVLFIPGLSGTLSAYWERKDIKDLKFESRTTGFAAGMNFSWESSLQSIVQAGLIHKELYEKSAAGSDSNTVKNSGSLKFVNLWDRRDSFMVPRRGLYANLETELSTGIDNKADDFIKYSLDMKYFFTPYGPVTFALSGKLNYLQMTGSRSEPSVDQLFFLGGSSTVRGSANNMFLKDDAGDPLGGKLSALFTFEPRFEFRKNWEIPLFIDTGLISETAYDNGETIRSTAGTGLRYITPIGAMGLLWGFPLDIKDGWKQGAFHFSIGYTF
jgi:outer membrane protein insertion porin family